MTKGKGLKRVACAALLLSLAFVMILQLCSCSLLTDPDTYITEDRLNEILDGRLDGNITVEGGDSYEVTIDGVESSNVAAASKALLSCVSVQCAFETEYVSGWGPNASIGTRDAYSLGSGVIFRMNKNAGEAYILTNYHVVYYDKANTDNGVSDDIIVMLYGKEYTNYAIPATYVGGSMTYDLAVLKVSGSRILAESSAVAADFADSNDAAVLDTAIAIGNPEGEGISATVGHVNVDSEYINMIGSDGKTDLRLRVIRTDAAVNSGNSGGGLFNSTGELIGIVNAKMASEEGSTVDNIGYAIPANVARYVAENILYHCNGEDKTQMQRSTLGLFVTAIESYADYDTESGRVYKREVVAVSSVDTGKLAAGKIQKDDVIKSIVIDGVVYRVDRVYKVVDSMINARVGSTVVVNIVRGGAEMSITLTVGAKNVEAVK